MSDPPLPLAVDFGTCYSRAALVVDGRPQAVTIEGQALVPSAVLLNKRGEFLVGLAAKHQKAVRPGSYQEEFKRVLGQSEKLILGEREMTAQELVAKVLTFVKRRVESMSGPHPRTVLTVPASYEEYRRDLMEGAAHEAGFEQVTLLEEPVAAALARGNGSLIPDGLSLVYDLGGGTFDVALVRYSGGRGEVLGSDGLDDVGGANFDRAIEGDLRDQSKDALDAVLSGLESDDPAEWLRAKRAELTARDVCERIKINLSQVEDADDTLILPDVEIEYALTRDGLERMVAGKLDQTIETCKRLLASVGRAPDELDSVLLVGGSCNLPFIAERVERAFGRPAQQVLNPELAVCHGAARWSELAAQVSAKTPVTEATNRPQRRPPRRKPIWSRVSTSLRAIFKRAVGDERIVLLDVCRRSSGTETVFLLTRSRLLFRPTAGNTPVRVLPLARVKNVRRVRGRVIVSTSGDTHIFEHFQHESADTALKEITAKVLAQQEGAQRRATQRRQRENRALMRRSSAWRAAGVASKVAALEECSPFERLLHVAHVSLKHAAFGDALALVLSERLVLIENAEPKGGPAAIEIRNGQATEFSGRPVKPGKDLAAALQDIGEQLRSTNQKTRAVISRHAPRPPRRPRREVAQTPRRPLVLPPQPQSAQAPSSDELIARAGGSTSPSDWLRMPPSGSTSRPGWLQELLSGSTLAPQLPTLPGVLLPSASRLARFPAWSKADAKVRQELIAAIKLWEQIVDLDICDASGMWSRATLVVTSGRVVWGARKLLGEVVVRSASYDEITELTGGLLGTKVIFRTAEGKYTFSGFKDNAARKFVEHIRARLPAS